MLRRFMFSGVVIFALFFTIVRTQAQDGDYSYHGCLYLCWDKVVNNQLTWDELEVMARQQDWRIGRASPYVVNPDVTIRSIGLNSIDFNAFDQRNKDHSAFATSWVYIAAEGTVEAAEIELSKIGEFIKPQHSNRQTWNTFNPANLLSVYGPPSAISAYIVYTDSGAGRGITFFWEAQGIVAGYSLNRSLDYSDTIETCLRMEDIWAARFVFYPTEEFETRLRQKNGIRLPEENKVQQLTNFASLEEMTEAIVAGDCFELTAEPF